VKLFGVPDDPELFSASPPSFSVITQSTISMIWLDQRCCYIRAVTRITKKLTENVDVTGIRNFLRQTAGIATTPMPHER